MKSLAIALVSTLAVPAASAGPHDPGALVEVTMDSTVGVVLDEIPEGLRATGGRLTTSAREARSGATARDAPDPAHDLPPHLPQLLLRGQEACSRCRPARSGSIELDPCRARGAGRYQGHDAVVVRDYRLQTTIAHRSRLARAGRAPAPPGGRRVEGAVQLPARSRVPLPAHGLRLHGRGWIPARTPPSRERLAALRPGLRRRDAGRAVLPRHRVPRRVVQGGAAAPRRPRRHGPALRADRVERRARPTRCASRRGTRPTTAPTSRSSATAS